MRRGQSEGTEKPLVFLESKNEIEKRRLKNSQMWILSRLFYLGWLY